MKKNKLTISNTTNSSSINDQLSRIFIGNLNTNKICKKHILKLFSKYGKIKAISMHKGYAFVQFKNKDQATYAVKEQNGQLVGGQIIDVNLVTDPKPHQKKIVLQKQNGIQNLEKNNSSATKICSEEIKNEENFIINKEVSLECKINSFNNEDVSLKNLNKNLESSEPLNNFGSVNEKIWLKKKSDSLNYLSFSLNSLNNQSTDKSFLHLNHYLNNPENYSIETSTNNLTTSLTSSNEEIYKNFLSNFIQSSNSIKMNQLLLKKDLLICGNCKTIYDDLNLFTKHKSLCVLNL